MGDACMKLITWVMPAHSHGDACMAHMNDAWMHSIRTDEDVMSPHQCRDTPQIVTQHDTTAVIDFPLNMI